MKSLIKISLAAAIMSMAAPSLAIQVNADQDSPSADIEVDEEIVIQGRRNLGHQIKKGFAAFNAGEFEKAETYFYRVRAKYQLNASITFQFMTDTWNLTSVTGARDVHTAATDRDARKGISVVFYMEGMSQKAQGELMAARKSFKRALNMNPSHFDARADLALVDIELGKTDLAAKHLKRLTRDMNKCEPEGFYETCTAIDERLLEVEVAYAQAVAS